ncbi:MAG: long-chain fatty acid--CoA ligase [Thaumarchaeota archaeon]|nr:long-chain fatty acid--CoA ligase [Nitrososphaerota archaeon]
MFFGLSQRPWAKTWPSNVEKSIEYPTIPLQQILTSSAEKYPLKAAVKYFLKPRLGVSLTYQQIAGQAKRFAAALQTRGIKKGDRIALFLPNIPQFIIAFYGGLMAGATIVPCNPLYKERELEHQLNDSEARVLVASCDVLKGEALFRSVEAVRKRTRLEQVVTTSVADYLPPVKRLLTRLGGLKKMSYPDTIDFSEFIRSDGEPSPVNINPTEDIALLQYTGGTTGSSKGAMLTHYNLVCNAIMTSKWLPMVPSDVNMAVLPYFHIYGLTVTMNAPILTGASIVMLPRFDVQALLRILDKERVTIFCGVPAMYVAVINNPESKNHSLKSVRACISGAAALPLAVMKAFDELTGGSLVEGYGLTEASPVTHCNPLDSKSKVRPGSIGMPFPDTDARIMSLDEPSKVLSAGEIGQLAVNGPQVMKGYWNREDETRKILQDGWLLTGDIAKMDEDGYFYIVDRLKDMIDVGGLKVYPKEIEEVLFEHPAVKEAAVIGVPDPKMGEVPKAYVALKEEHEKTVSAEDLVKHCREKLAPHKAPRVVEIRKDLPKTLIGKVLRRQLKEEEAQAPKAT